MTDQTDILKCFYYHLFKSTVFGAEGSYKYLTFPEAIQAMNSYLTSGNLQVLGFALTTIGWILEVASMGLVDWRVWHLDNTTSIISSGMVWVGIWKVCFYSTILFSPQSRSAKICHTYSIYSTFLPQDFRVAQIIFLVICILGVLGKVFIVIAMRNFNMRTGPKSSICNPFFIGGFFYVCAGICLLICVIWNFHSVFKNEIITFPATFYIPSRLKTQEIGHAVPLAIISAILMFLGGVFFLFYKLHLNTQVHPMTTEEI
ncbi:claudin-34 isoform X2 [Macrotis lagotis]|uniref:claudin-34 isoform X2 n=1 Tax=Macrotis lagotis TaxID=92651 RepID=UPI003D69B449